MHWSTIAWMVPSQYEFENSIFALTYHYGSLGRGSFAQEAWAY
jgi:hypothetical protein